MHYTRCISNVQDFSDDGAVLHRCRTYGTDDKETQNNLRRLRGLTVFSWTLIIDAAPTALDFFTRAAFYTDAEPTVLKTKKHKTNPDDAETLKN
ncbi:hypothetical protein J5I95_14990 [Candidatus Poribacteria bacterium]|nr:hypothetical protein [Candidatus Poribacteria bacterium]